MTDDDVSKQLAALPREAVPPPEVEAQIVAALRAKGVLRTRSARWPAVAGAVIAVAASVLLGIWIGTKPSSRPATGQEKYLLLLYEPAGYQAPPAGGEHAREAEYDAWATALAKAGHLTVAEALAERFTELRPGLPTTHGIRATAEDGPDGFFVISAGDEASAVAIANTCPHLHYGGQVRVWPIRYN